MKRFPRFVTALSLLVLTFAISARGQATAPTTTNSDQPGPLQIHVTAVQGQAQFRPDSNTKWKTVEANSDLPEGVEIRTGPKGTVQFTVGSDQVFRVDRLTVVKVLRANLNPDGTIRTDVGMTYGRVSKDVDQPQHPHQDTIISPSSTLAVRGTQVGFYDQPPFTPEATSITGQAYFRNLHGSLVALGGHGTGFAHVDGNSSNSGQYNLQNNLVDPNGNFSGHTSTDQQTLINALGGLQGTQLGVFQYLSGTTGAAPPNTSIVGALPVPGNLQFVMGWSSSTPNTEVYFSVTSPRGELVDINHQTAPSGGAYNTSSSQNIASSFAEQEVDWGNSTAKFPFGNYTLNVTFQGVNNGTLQPLTKSSTESINLFSVLAQQNPPGGSSLPTTFSSTPSPITLNANNPTEKFIISVPIPQTGVTITEIDSHGHVTKLPVPPG
jgi:hypothetical protein